MVNHEEFEKVVKPLIEWMNNFHPHTKLIVTGTSAELVEGVMGTVTEEFLRD